MWWTCAVVSVLLIIPSSPRKRNHWVLVVIWTSRFKRITASHLIQAVYFFTSKSWVQSSLLLYCIHTHTVPSSISISRLIHLLPSFSLNISPQTQSLWVFLSHNQHIHKFLVLLLTSPIQTLKSQSHSLNSYVFHLALKLSSHNLSIM